MSYYLSYIEIGTHAALMLSEQPSTSDPIKVIYEIGFAYSPDSIIGFLPEELQGNLREERNANSAFEGTHITKHRTFEISELEAKAFFHIINRDRNLNTAKVSVLKGSTRQERVVGGPAYHRLKHNCKTYALGVLKELGIIEAENLSNFLIQRPKSKPELLNPLSKDELTCPLKEDLLQKAPSVVSNIEETIAKVDLAAKDEEASKLWQELQRKAPFYIKGFFADYDKISIDACIQKYLIPFASSLDSISSTAASTDQTFLTMREQLASLINDANKVNELSKERKLEFFWREPLPLTKRIHLDHFRPDEKAVYCAKIKSNEMSDGLEQILLDLDEQMHAAKSFSHTEYADFMALKKIIVDAKLQNEAEQAVFLDSIEGKDADEIIQACANRQLEINALIDNVADQVDSYKPQTEKVSSFIQFIQRILSYIKKDVVNVAKTQSLFKDTLANLKLESRSADLKEELSDPKQERDEDSLIGIVKSTF